MSSLTPSDLLGTVTRQARSRQAANFHARWLQGMPPALPGPGERLAAQPIHTDRGLLPLLDGAYTLPEALPGGGQTRWQAEDVPVFRLTARAVSPSPARRGLTVTVIVILSFTYTDSSYCVPDTALSAFTGIRHGLLVTML